MRFSGRTHPSRLFIRGKSQQYECRANIRKWIASLANSAWVRSRLCAVSSICHQAEATPQYKTPDG